MYSSLHMCCIYFLQDWLGEDDWETIPLGDNFLFRVCTGHGEPGKSLNFRISFFRPGKSWNLSAGHGKSWEMVLIKKIQIIN